MIKKIFLSLLVVASLGYFCWSYVVNAHGDQHVSYEPSSKECNVGKSGKWKYCIHNSQQGTNGGVAYLFHGRNLDEQTWNDDTYYTSMLQHYWAESRLKPPVIITISFGPVWLLSPKGRAAASGLLDVFRDEVIPEVESKLDKPKYRAVFGESMGGLNALIVGLTSPQLFQKVAALCPPIQ